MYQKDRAIWLLHKDAIWKEVNDFMKTEGYSLSKTKEADIEAMILGIAGNCRVDPKRLLRKTISSVCSQKRLQTRMVSINVRTAISTFVQTN